MYRIRRLKNKIKRWLLISCYLMFYYLPKLEKYWVLVDSKNGKDLGSNMLRIAEELALNKDYKKYKVYLSCNKSEREKIAQMLETYHMQNVKIIRESGLEYAKAVAMAKFLFTDTSFPIWFTKKEGQIITNTWHGTPLKKMGRDVSNRAFDMGNVQKNHLIADYLLYPSDYMKDIMTSAYMLNNLYKGKILCSGYPRNSVFFEEEKAKELRTKLGLDGKRLYGYMPTWRGVLKHLDPKKNTDQVEYYFVQLDKKLRDDEIFFVRLHPFIGNDLDFSGYKHIKPFPAGYDPYDILNICDCLVTDYSSVFFDYANKRNKIVLFAYDKEAYMDERGVYVSMDEFPFPVVRRVDELLVEMRSPKQYDDQAFVDKYCKYDRKNVAELVCRHIIKGEKQFEEYSAESNGKENILIYSGNLAKNGLTTALLNLLENVDTDKRNYVITFRSKSLEKNPERVSMLPDSVMIQPIPSIDVKSLGERLALYLVYNKNKTNKYLLKIADRFYKRLYRSCFGVSDYKHVIHYSGYEKDIINLFLQADAKKTIFVHNDMVEEIRTKSNQHKNTLCRAYRSYDYVVPVTVDISAPTKKLGATKENIRIINNCHGYKHVLNRMSGEISFEKDTVSTVSIERLKEILDSNVKKFITIGRFSREKGHDMLIKAFEKYHKENPESYLIIIGGYGSLFEETLMQAECSEAAANIVIIKSIANPMPILKKCDLFILSSLYEGLGLVILEADTVGVPVISTDIPGPQGFMRENNGYLVSVSTEALYEGMKAFDQGKVKVMNVDFEAYNKRAVQQFEKLFEGEM